MKALKLGTTYEHNQPGIASEQQVDVILHPRVSSQTPKLRFIQRKDEEIKVFTCLSTIGEFGYPMSITVLCLARYSHVTTVLAEVFIWDFGMKDRHPFYKS